MSNPTPNHDVILPPNYLAVLGGGQLGRMFCHAAQAMGYKTLVLDPSYGPAAQVSDGFIQADYDEVQALNQLNEMTLAITTEFENVPAQSLKNLSYKSRVSPTAAPVAVAQDRISEKAFIAAHNIPVAPYAEIRTLADFNGLDEALFPGILKLARMGYDGKGQARVNSVAEAKEAFKAFDQKPCVLEAMLPLKKEISVVMARSLAGEMVCYPSGINTHIDGILSSTEVIPGKLPEALISQAQNYAQIIAKQLNYVGVLCVEFFVLDDGQLIVNEIAPRPHNSGHYTMDACASSQFEQQVRAMAGLTLGSTHQYAPCIMLNILGDSWLHYSQQPQEPDWASVLALSGVSLHLYGKEEARKGRKMGHLNIVNTSVDQLYQTARQVSDILHLGAKV